MGLNLHTIHLNDWLYSIEAEKLPQLRKELVEKIGEIPDDDSVSLDNYFPRVGSYTAYGIFQYLLIYLTIGDYETDLEPDEDYELEALKEFRKTFEAGSINIKYVEHFIETDDSTTIFLTTLFDSPFEFYGRPVASLPAAIDALESFSKSIDFDIRSDFELERVDDKWFPIATAKNVSRIIYQFFIKNRDICIDFA